jgi:hypothetical protein
VYGDEGYGKETNMDPAGGAADLVAGGINLVANSIDGTLGLVDHLENVAVAADQAVVQTAVDINNEAAGATDRGFDKTLQHVRELLQQASQELQAGVREFGAGLPKVG